MTRPTPRQRTIDEVAAPYSNFLVRVPPTGEEVCAVCHSCSGPHRVCDRCFEAWEELGDHGTADVVGFVSMAPRGEQLARDLFTYKDDRTRVVDRQKMMIGLAAVLWKWLGRHEPCLADSLDFVSFDVITTVPSTSGRAHHPLPALVSEVVTSVSERYKTLLQVHRTDLEKRQQAADRYTTTQDVAGSRVLVIDDTWTTGAHAQSAAAALKGADAAAVAVVAIGRWFNPNYGTGRGWLNKHRKPGWDWDTCCLEAEA